MYAQPWLRLMIMLSICIDSANSVINSEVVQCEKDKSCQCNGARTSACTLKCSVEDCAKDSVMTCSAGRACTIYCDSPQSCSGKVKIDASQATDVTIRCNADGACEGSGGSSLITCGTGDCSLLCDVNGEYSNACKNIEVDAPTSYTRSFTCEGVCNRGQIPNNHSPNPTASPTNKPTNNPTNYPTKRPTTNPTHSPTLNPTHNPTFQPTAARTPNPTHQSTISPTFQPTVEHTLNPSHQPTESPTKTLTINPSTHPTFNPSESPSKTFQIIVLSCNEDVVGSYNGESLIFHTTMPFKGELIFDATTSNFPIATIKAFDASHELLATGTNEQKTVSIDAFVGVLYTFVVTGDTENAAIYHVNIVCIPAITSTDNPSNTEFGSEKETDNKANTSTVIYITFGVIICLFGCICFFFIMNCIAYKPQKPKQQKQMQMEEADELPEIPMVGSARTMESQDVMSVEDESCGTNAKLKIARLPSNPPMLGMGEVSLTLSFMSRSEHAFSPKQNESDKQSSLQPLQEDNPTANIGRSSFVVSEISEDKPTPMNTILNVVKSQFSSSTVSTLNKKQIESDSEGDETDD